MPPEGVQTLIESPQSPAATAPLASRGAMVSNKMSLLRSIIFSNGIMIAVPLRVRLRSLGLRGKLFDRLGSLAVHAASFAEVSEILYFD